ncbi:amidohydrolase family protein [Kutzneria buriramensis]|uniref:Imidazolonepropionase-like amidohydrolase n=1 Tax=Kutzneria buriramensis TaxID=1045776 RepID=A0A3E0H4H2_9PSEU|nr:amidohydrolase family protein [Kutzneria buriramensis]REH38145.1 imidazolonepropionase-like amidohydrolase [Kutzneria buriramensis]
MIGLRCARLFDGDVLHHGPTTVAVDGGRIVPAAGDFPVVDLGDVTLMPGLVDSHVHLAFEPGSDIPADMASASREVLLERMRRHALQALRAGVTTLRDLGDRDYLALELRDALGADGPEILAAGPPITSPGGHCWFLGGETPPDRLAHAVADRVARGVDVIKVMATGGGITPGSAPHESQYGLPELRVVVGAAHAAGLRVTAHAHGGAGIRDAVAAGVDGIEHCTFLTDGGADPDWSTVEAIVVAGVYVGVTAARMSSGYVLPPHIAAARANFARMQALGARLVFCSDAGIIADKPHHCLPYALPDIQDLAQVSAAAVLTSVTRLAAESCGLGRRKGRIAPGYDADLLAVHGDPTQDLTAMTDVAAVYRAGNLVT